MGPKACQRLREGQIYRCGQRKWELVLTFGDAAYLELGSYIEGCSTAINSDFNYGFRKSAQEKLSEALEGG